MCLHGVSMSFIDLLSDCCYMCGFSSIFNKTHAYINVLFVVCCVLFVCSLLRVVCGWLFIVCCLRYVVCCL